MKDLTPKEVRTQALALGLEIPEEDLAEVTFRLNALSETLAALEHPDLDTVEYRAVFDTPEY